jgi:hypothetical protein
MLNCGAAGDETMERIGCVPVNAEERGRRVRSGMMQVG